jgi:hypothetical protein
MCKKHRSDEKCIQILVSKSGMKRPHRRLRHIRKDNNLVLKEIACKGVDWISLAQ